MSASSEQPTVASSCAPRPISHMSHVSCVRISQRKARACDQKMTDRDGGADTDERADVGTTVAWSSGGVTDDEDLREDGAFERVAREAAALCL